MDFTYSITTLTLTAIWFIIPILLITMGHLYMYYSYLQPLNSVDIVKYYLWCLSLE